MSKKVFFYSMSCGVSEVNPQNIEEIIGCNEDLEITPDFEESDLIIFDGCISNGNAFPYMQNSCAELLRGTGKNVPIYVIGCGAKATIDMVPAIENPRIKILSGDWSKKLVEELNSEYEGSLTSLAEVRDEDISLRIQSGCLRHCVFCKTNYAPFPLKSKSLEEIRSFFEILHDVPEDTWPSHSITLLGQNPIEYGIDLYRERKLHEIINMIKECDAINKTYIRHLNAAEFYPRLIESINSSNKINGVEIHLETASNRLLKLMKRGYTKERFEALVKELRSGNSKDMTISTDIIAGYPTETEEDVAETIAFLKANRIILRYVYPYVDSIYLPNQELPRVPDEVVQRRVIRYNFHKLAQQKNL